MTGPSAETSYVLDEYKCLRSWGIPRSECAHRLHRSQEALQIILRRAAQRGDPRSDWTPHTDECSGSVQSLQHHRERARRWVA